MRAVDRYTLEFRLKATDYNLPVHRRPRPVRRGRPRGHRGLWRRHRRRIPVGTGPYVLKQWLRAAKIVLEANPDYRGFTWDFRRADPAWDDALVKAMRGKQMPQIGRVEISIIEEEQSRWLAFNQKELDILALPATFRPEVFDADNRIKAEWTEQGVSLFKAIDPHIAYTFFNFRDPLVGGFSKEKIALRRAIIMGYNLEEEIRVIRKQPGGRRGNADTRRRGRPRPDLSQHQSATTPTLANKLLDYFKYTRGKDGYRTLPDGKPLVIRQANGTTAIERELQRAVEEVDGRHRHPDGVPDRQVRRPPQGAKACQLMMWGAAWTADYPDGDNFMQLLYGPNTGQSNNGCYESKAFDAFYVKIDDVAQLAGAQFPVPRDDAADGSRRRVEPCRSRASATRLIRPWVLGFKKHPILHAEWQYMDLEPRPMTAARRTRRSSRARPNVSRESG